MIGLLLTGVGAAFVLYLMGLFVWLTQTMIRGHRR